MSFYPNEPTLRVTPTKVAAGIYVIHEVQHALGDPLSVYLNSLVIQAAEPVIVDTGTVRNRGRGWRTHSVSSTRTMCAGCSSATTTPTTPATSPM